MSHLNAFHFYPVLDHMSHGYQLLLKVSTEFLTNRFAPQWLVLCFAGIGHTRPLITSKLLSVLSEGWGCFSFILCWGVNPQSFCTHLSISAKCHLLGDIFLCSTMHLLLCAVLARFIPPAANASFTHISVSPLGTGSASASECKIK